jgi:hypothetical protein
MAHRKNLRPAPDICYELLVLVGELPCGVILYIFKLGLPPCTYRKHYHSSTPLHIMTTRSSIPQKRRKEDDDQDEIVKDGRLTTAAENFFEAVCM